MTKEELISQIEKSIASCKKCRLFRNATNPVPGCGNVNAKIVFIGEAPGFHEDQQGKPFVGRAGKLLDSLLLSLNIQRKEVWIGNIIKHRPPENRDPLADEIAACSPYLAAQLKIIKPKVIVTLGRFALNFFVKDAKISNDHGVPLLSKGNIVFPLYHPAAALRNGEIERILRKDFKRLPEVLSGDIKPKDLNSGNLKETEGQMSFI